MWFFTDRRESIYFTSTTCKKLWPKNPKQTNKKTENNINMENMQRELYIPNNHNKKHTFYFLRHFNF